MKAPCYWEMTNNKEFLEGIPLETIDMDDLAIPDVDERMTFLTYFFRAGKFFNIQGGHAKILWMPQSPKVDLICFLEGIVATSQIAQVVESFAPGEVQRIPASYKGDTKKYEILNFTKSLDCLDQRKSEVRYHHHVKDHKVALTKTIIDSSKAKGSQVFRLSDHLITLVVTDALRAELLRHKVVGPLFIPLEN